MRLNPRSFTAPTAPSAAVPIRAVVLRVDAETGFNFHCRGNFVLLVSVENLVYSGERGWPGDDCHVPSPRCALRKIKKAPLSQIDTPAMQTLSSASHEAHPFGYLVDNVEAMTILVVLVAAFPSVLLSSRKHVVGREVKPLGDCNFDFVANSTRTQPSLCIQPPLPGRPRPRFDSWRRAAGAPRNCVHKMR